MTAQTARRATARPRPRPSVAPRHPRRVSGPAAARERIHTLRGVGGVPAGAASTAIPARRARQSTSAFERLARIADHRIVDTLLRSRVWIVVVGVLLGGIVAMQVSLLKLNSGISRAVEAGATLERQNADIQDKIARLSSSQRVSSKAAQAGMVLPPAGEVTYLRARPGRDAAAAARHISPPSPAAAAVMSSGGHATATPTPPAG